MWPLTKHGCQNHRGLSCVSHSLKSFAQYHPNLVRWNKHMRWSQIENAAIGASAFTVNRVRYTWWLSSDCYRPPRTTWSSFIALGRRGQTPVGTMTGNAYPFSPAPPHPYIPWLLPSPSFQASPPSSPPSLQGNVFVCLFVAT